MLDELHQTLPNVRHSLADVIAMIKLIDDKPVSWRYRETVTLSAHCPHCSVRHLILQKRRSIDHWNAREHWAAAVRIALIVQFRDLPANGRRDLGRLGAKAMHRVGQCARVTAGALRRMSDG